MSTPVTYTTCCRDCVESHLCIMLHHRYDSLSGECHWTPSRFASTSEAAARVCPSCGLRGYHYSDCQALAAERAAAGGEDSHGR